jgi:hypothetical protein
MNMEVNRVNIYIYNIKKILNYQLLKKYQLNNLENNVRKLKPVFVFIIELILKIISKEHIINQSMRFLWRHSKH